MIFSNVQCLMCNVQCLVFDAYCLFIYFLIYLFLIYLFLMLQIQTFFSNILLYNPNKNLQNPIFFRIPHFLPLSFFLSSLPLFSLFRPLYPGSWVRCSSAASLSLPFPSYKQKACRHHPHSDAPTGFSHTFISGIAIVILFLYFNHFFTSS